MHRSVCHNYLSDIGTLVFCDTQFSDFISLYTLQNQFRSVGPDATFFEESSVYWSPSSDSGTLYQQLADKKYREIFRHQIQ